MIESDASLVGRVRSGDSGAADILLRRHFRSAYLVALAGMGNPADAEDVLQDALINCLERIDDCEDPERFGAWLSRIVRNTAHNRRDYLRVRETQPIADGLEYPARERADQRVNIQELRRTLLDALSRLSENQREVVLLHDLDGWHHAEIAAVLGSSIGMSRRHLSDGRRKLREILGDYANLEPDHD
ncbi:MAG TPA: RNA polymerase sigma factor [Gemmatimonadaceae bacterium]|jgi:RNA polymerase sigma-70 factor (ECF subfamily)|nr:RNA polymerase sigma factor [Gemmatimonadaceae bacterium]